MAIPTFDNFIIPFLEELKDNQLHSMKEIKANIAKTFKLSEQDMSELTNSGYKKFDDRVGWARTYLKKSLLISSPERAKFRIEERGWQALKEKPQNILKYLKQYPEFLEFQGKDKNTLQTNNVQISECDDNQTPQDLIDKANLIIELSKDAYSLYLSQTPKEKADLMKLLTIELLFDGANLLITPHSAFSNLLNCLKSHKLETRGIEPLSKTDLNKLLRV